MSSSANVWIIALKSGNWIGGGSSSGSAKQDIVKAIDTRNIILFIVTLPKVNLNKIQVILTESG